MYGSERNETYLQYSLGIYTGGAMLSVTNLRLEAIDGCVTDFISRLLTFMLIYLFHSLKGSVGATGLPYGSCI